MDQSSEETSTAQKLALSLFMGGGLPEEREKVWEDCGAADMFLCPKGVCPATAIKLIEWSLMTLLPRDQQLSISLLHHASGVLLPKRPSGNALFAGTTYMYYL